MRRSWFTLLGSSLLVCCLLVMGCEETVDPFVDTDNRFYTLFGWLDTDADTQYVRVIPLRRTIAAPTDPDPLDATVTLTEMETGRSVAMQDSIIFFEHAPPGHVFYAPLKAKHGLTYRLEVQRPDGATSSAETTVPSLVQAHVGPPQSLFFADSSALGQVVEWENVEFSPFRVQVWYRIAGEQPNHPFRDLPVTYTDVGEQEASRWMVKVNLEEDKKEVLDKLGIQSTEGYPLFGIGMQITVPDANWRPPGGVFDPEVLVQPGTFSNVDNGFGFFGAVAQYRVEWTLPQAITNQLGFPFPRKTGP